MRGRLGSLAARALARVDGGAQALIILNGYFAGKVAIVGGLHAVVAQFAASSGYRASTSKNFSNSANPNRFAPDLFLSRS